MAKCALETRFSLPKIKITQTNRWWNAFLTIKLYYTMSESGKKNPKLASARPLDENCCEILERAEYQEKESDT